MTAEASPAGFRLAAVAAAAAIRDADSQAIAIERAEGPVHSSPPQGPLQNKKKRCAITRIDMYTKE